jgi:hypothetical protein
MTGYPPTDPIHIPNGKAMSIIALIATIKIPIIKLAFATPLPLYRSGWRLIFFRLNAPNNTAKMPNGSPKIGIMPNIENINPTIPSDSVFLISTFCLFSSAGRAADS